MIRAAILLILAIGSAVAQDAALADNNTGLRGLHEQVDKHCLFAKERLEKYAQLQRTKAQKVNYLG